MAIVLNAAKYIQNDVEKEGDRFKWGIQLKRVYYNPGFSSGVAGIGMLFTKLYVLTKDNIYLSYAEGAARWILSVAVDGKDGSITWCSHDDEACWYLTPDKDISGIIKFLLELYLITKQPIYLEYSEKAAQWILKNALIQDGPGIYVLYNPPRQAAFGIYSYVQRDVGTLMIKLYNVTGKVKYLNVAVLIGDWITYTCECDEKMCKWRDDRGYGNTYSVEGASSLADFLYELYLTTKSTKYLHTAEKLVNWIESKAVKIDEKTIKLPDFRGKFVTVIQGYWDRPFFPMTPADIFLKSYRITGKQDRLKMAEMFGNWLIQVSSYDMESAKIPFSEGSDIFHPWINARIAYFVAQLYYYSRNQNYLIFYDKLINWVHEKAVKEKGGYVWPREDGRRWSTFGYGEGVAAIAFYVLASIECLRDRPSPKLHALAQEAMELVDVIDKSLYHTAIVLGQRNIELKAKALATLAGFLLSTLSTYPNSLDSILAKEVIEKGLDISIEELIKGDSNVKIKTIDFYSKTVKSTVLNTLDEIQRISVDLKENININDPFIIDFIHYLRYSKRIFTEYYSNINQLIESYRSFEEIKSKIDFIVWMGGIIAIVFTGGTAYPIVVFVGLSNNVYKIMYLKDQTNLYDALVNQYVAQVCDGKIRIKSIVETIKYLLSGGDLPRLNVNTAIIDSSLPIVIQYLENRGKMTLSVRITVHCILQISPLNPQQTFVPPFHTFTYAYHFELKPGETYSLANFPQLTDEAQKWVKKAHDLGYDVIMYTKYLIEYRISDSFVVGLKEITGYSVTYTKPSPTRKQWAGTYTQPYEVSIVTGNNFMILLKELPESHKVHLSVYDMGGRLTGLDRESMSLRQDIPGSKYVVFEGGVMALIPSNITISKILVDGATMEEELTYFNVSIMQISSNRVLDINNFSSAIRKNEQIEIILPTMILQKNEYLKITLLGIVILAVATILFILFKKRG